METVCLYQGMFCISIELLYVILGAIVVLIGIFSLPSLIRKKNPYRTMNQSEKEKGLKQAEEQAKEDKARHPEKYKKEGGDS